MERITISIDDELAKALDALMESRGYTSRSEAMRDLIRREINADQSSESGRGECVASLSYVYNHHVRDLAERLAATQHAHHSLVVSTAHVHLDHDFCLENTFLRGPTGEVRKFADGIRAQRGVSYGQINLITVAASDKHGAAAHHTHRGHLHLTPVT